VGLGIFLTELGPNHGGRSKADDILKRRIAQQCLETRALTLRVVRA